MAVLEIILSAVFSTLLTVPVMLILYHKVIIPKILVGVKADLPPAIMAIVDQKLAEFKSFIEDKFESARMAILGKNGNQKRLLGYAARFLEKNGVTEDTVQTVADRYGTEILEMIAKAAKPEQTQKDTFGFVKD